MENIVAIAIAIAIIAWVFVYGVASLRAYDLAIDIGIDVDVLAPSIAENEC